MSSKFAQFKFKKLLGIPDPIQEVRKRRKELYEKRMKQYAKNDVTSLKEGLQQGDAKPASDDDARKPALAQHENGPQPELDRRAEGVINL